MQLPFNDTYLLASWFEVFFYGIYVSLFWSSLYIVLMKKSHRTVPSKVMFVAMIVMFMLATMHNILNLFRLLQGYVWFRDAPGGPAAYYNELARWDHVLKNVIFFTQVIVGDMLAIYRCWVVWNNNSFILVLPLTLLICSIISGYIICWLFTQLDGASIFYIRFLRWTTAFYSLAIVQNVTTTSLLIFQIWRCERRLSTSLDPNTRSSLVPIISIIIQSAVIYATVQVAVLVLYIIKHNAQFIPLEVSTPMAGIVFTLITVRIALRTGKMNPTGVSTEGSGASRPLTISSPSRLSRYTTHNRSSDVESFQSYEMHKPVHRGK